MKMFNRDKIKKNTHKGNKKKSQPKAKLSSHPITLYLTHTKKRESEQGTFNLSNTQDQGLRRPDDTEGISNKLDRTGT